MATKAELKVAQDNILKLQTHYLNYFLGKNVFGDNGPQNMFADQPIIDKLELKNKDINYGLIWKSKVVYTSKVEPLYNSFLHSIKLFGYRMGIKFVGV